MQDGNDAICVVVYYSATYLSGSFVAEYWSFDGSTLALTGGITNPVVLQSGVSFQSTINVDGVGYGSGDDDFMIVWDQLVSSKTIPLCIAGHLVSGVPTLYYTTPQSVQPSGGGSYDIKNPDIAMTDSVGTSEFVYFTWIVASTGAVEIIWDRVGQYQSNSPAPNPALYRSLSAGTSTYNFPRIATMNESAPGANVAVAIQTTTAGGSNNITLETYSVGNGWNVDVLNDASHASWPVINAAPNFKPAISSDNTGTRYFVAWNFDNSGSTYGANYHPGDILPVAVETNAQGNPQNSPYWDVPKTISTDQKYVSICGRRVADAGLSWWDANTVDMTHKVVTAPSGSFRVTELPINKQELSKLKLLQVFDVSGHLIIQHESEAILSNNFNNSKNIPNGIYLLKSIYQNGDTTTKKYFKNME